MILIYQPTEVVMYGWNIFTMPVVACFDNTDDYLDQYEDMVGKAVSTCIFKNWLDASMRDDLTVEAKLAVLECGPYLRSGKVRHPPSYVWRAVSNKLTNYLIREAEQDNIRQFHKRGSVNPSTQREDQEDYDYAARQITNACLDDLDHDIVQLRIDGLSVRETARTLATSRRKVTDRLAGIFYRLPESIRDRYLNRRWLLPQIRESRN